MEKKLRIFDLSKFTTLNGSTTSGDSDSSIVSADKGFEIGSGVHKGTIKSIVWTLDPNVLVTVADDKMIRWWDLSTRTVVQEQPVEGEIGSCEFTNVKGEEGDIGGGLPVLTIAAGKIIYFYGGSNARTLLKKAVMPYEVASVALHPGQRKYVTGGAKDTWAKVYEYDSGKEIGLFTQLCKLVRNTDSLQMCTKATTVRSGASASRQMASCTRLEARMAPSRCGRIALDLTVCGVRIENNAIFLELRDSGSVESDVYRI